MIQPLENGLPTSGSSRNGDPSRRTGGVYSSADSSLPVGDNHPVQTAGAVNLLDILTNMGMNLGNIQSLVQLLSTIGGLDAKDYQDQLYQLLLKQYITQEQRNFDKDALSEQRSYDSPIAQLSRLMGAGISRNQAIQMLSGASEPSLVGSGLDAALPSQVASPSEKAMQVAQTALDAVGVVGGLISLGFSAPAAIQQVKYLKNQNSLTSMQLQSYGDASTAFSILNNAGAAADSFGSVANAAKAITSLADNGNDDAKQFIASGGLKRLQDNSYFTSPALSSLYKNERASDDYDKSFGLYVEQTEADIDFKKADKSRVIQQIDNLKAEFSATLTTEEFTRSQIALQEFHKQQIVAQTDLLRKQGKESEARALEIKAQTNLLVSQTKTNDLPSISVL